MIDVSILADAESMAAPRTSLDAVKDGINFIFQPEIYISWVFVLFLLAMVYYRKWTKPLVFWPMMIIAALLYVVSFTDHNFMTIVGKPDNVPITILIFTVVFFVWLGFRQAAINDERIDRGEPLFEAGKDDKVLVWPDLVYTELICLVLGTVVLILWSVYLKAPLEEPANPNVTPNPSKAPWYFLGLQEMLVYFDPWMAGVVLPGLIVFGLLALPIIDTNPKGNGYYTFKERKFAIGMFHFGFVILWVVLIVLGTFMRGPNWNFFGPYETWDVTKLLALTNVNLSEMFWINWLGTTIPKPDTEASQLSQAMTIVWRESPGIVAILFYLLILPALLTATIFRKLRRQLGFTRYLVLMVLFLSMMSLPLKMALRWTVNLKYIFYSPEWFFNI